MRAPVERISGWPVVEIALELCRDKEPNPCAPGGVDEVELFRVRDGRDEKVDSLECISQLFDVSKVNHGDLAPGEVFLEFRVGLRKVLLLTTALPAVRLGRGSPAHRSGQDQYRVCGLADLLC